MQPTPAAAKFLCTAEMPWDGSTGKRVEHDNIVRIGEHEDGYPAGDIITWKCLNCGHIWEEELPQ